MIEKKNPQHHPRIVSTPPAFGVLFRAFRQASPKMFVSICVRRLHASVLFFLSRMLPSIPQLPRDSEHPNVAVRIVAARWRGGSDKESVGFVVIAASQSKLSGDLVNVPHEAFVVCGGLACLRLIDDSGLVFSLRCRISPISFPLRRAMSLGGAVVVHTAEYTVWVQSWAAALRRFIARQR